MSFEWTDKPLVFGTHYIRGVHIRELRANLNALRQAMGMGLYTFEDPNIVDEASWMRIPHINDIRNAIDASWGARAYSNEPGNTQVGNRIPTPTGSPSDVDIRIPHIEELRDYLDAIHDSSLEWTLTSATLTAIEGASPVVGNHVRITVNFSSPYNPTYNPNPVFSFVSSDGNVCGNLSATPSITSGVSSHTFDFGETFLATGTVYFTVSVSNYASAGSVNSNSLTIAPLNQATKIILTNRLRAAKYKLWGTSYISYLAQGHTNHYVDILDSTPCSLIPNTTISGSMSMTFPLGNTMTSIRLYAQDMDTQDFISLTNNAEQSLTSSSNDAVQTVQFLGVTYSGTKHYNNVKILVGFTYAYNGSVFVYGSPAATFLFLAPENSLGYTALEAGDLVALLCSVSAAGTYSLSSNKTIGESGFSEFQENNIIDVSIGPGDVIVNITAAYPVTAETFTIVPNDGTSDTTTAPVDVATPVRITDLTVYDLATNNTDNELEVGHDTLAVSIILNRTTTQNETIELDLNQDSVYETTTTITSGQGAKLLTVDVSGFRSNEVESAFIVKGRVASNPSIITYGQGGRYFPSYYLRQGFIRNSLLLDVYPSANGDLVFTKWHPALVDIYYFHMSGASWVQDSKLLASEGVGYSWTRASTLPPIRAITFCLDRTAWVKATYTTRWSSTGIDFYGAFRAYDGYTILPSITSESVAYLMSQPGFMGQKWTAIMEGGGYGVWSLLRPVWAGPSSSFAFAGCTGYTISSTPYIQFIMSE